MPEERTIRGDLAETVESETERLTVLAAYGILDSPPESDFDDLVRIAAEICDTPIAVINFPGADRSFIKSQTHFTAQNQARMLAFCRLTVESDSFMQITDATVDMRFSGFRHTDDEPALRFYAGMPLRTADGYPIGAICILDFMPKSLSEHQIRLVELLARQAMAQVEMRKLISERDASLEEMREANQRRAVLTRELSHRMKNTLAVVQSIVSQTFRSAATLDGARSAITSRLNALARAQDLLTGSVSTSTGMRDAVEAALAPHRSGDGRIQIEGPNLLLNEQQTLGLTLAIHELATNALKHGALASEGGCVEIGWMTIVGGEFRFQWKETGGATVEQPSRRGFGTRLLERIVANYFSGKAELQFEPGGLVFVMTGTVTED